MIERLERLVTAADMRAGDWETPGSFCLGCGQRGSHGVGCPGPDPILARGSARRRRWWTSARG